MRNDNITKWADELATTTEKQATGALVLVNRSKTKAYCCLGFGSCVTMGDVKIEEPDDAAFDFASTDHFVDDEAAETIKVGEAEVVDLAPREFIEWLGYVLPESETGVSFDVYPDWPTNLLLRSNQDKADAERGGDDLHDGTGGPLTSESLATLNDNGFTFTQIADIIRHFGLSDNILGNR